MKLCKSSSPFKMKIHPVVIICFACLIFCSCGHKKGKVPQSKPSAPVETTTVRLLQPQKDITIPGELDAYYSTDVYPRVKGFIKSVYVDRGSVVKKGQVLARVDAPEIISDLNDARAKLSQAKANQIGTNETYKRLLITSKTPGAVAPNELSVARAKLDADNANVKSAEAIVQNKLKMVQYLTLTAPFNGTITTRNISVGDLVGPDETAKNHSLFSLQENQKLRLTVAVPETYSGELQKGETVSFRVSALPEKMFEAKLSRSSGSVDVSTRTMMIEFDVENKGRLLKSGMYAEVRLPIRRKTKTPFVPIPSVLNSTEGTFLILDENNRVRRCPVKKGVSLDSLVEVFGNVHDGDKIVKAPSDDMRDGNSINP